MENKRTVKQYFLLSSDSNPSVMNMHSGAFLNSDMGLYIPKITIVTENAARRIVRHAEKHGVRVPLFLADVAKGRSCCAGYASGRGWVF